MSGDPWADPSMPTEEVPPYSGPPQQRPPYQGAPYQGAPYQPYQPYPGTPYGWPPAGAQPSPYGWSPYGWWPTPPPGPRRPGQVVGAAVLAFAQSALVLFGSIYTFLIASVVGLAADQSLQVPGGVRQVATEARIVSVLQLASVVLLVVAGVLALGTRPRRATWPLLLAAFGAQVALAVYWSIRLVMLTSDLPGRSPGASFLGLTLFFAAGPLVGLGLVLIGSGRRWFAAPHQPDLRYPGAA